MFNTKQLLHKICISSEFSKLLWDFFPFNVWAGPDCWHFFFFFKSKGSLPACFGEVGSILDFLLALVGHRLLKSNYNSISCDVGLIRMVFHFVVFCFCFFEQRSFIGTSKIVLVLFLTKMCSSLFWNRYKRILIWLHENIWKRHSLVSYLYVLKRRRWH